MPIRWTAEVDQTLFFLVLKEMNSTVDYAAIAKAWPDNGGERPTARAISERLHKIKKTAIQNGSSPGKAGGAGASAAPKTPKKNPPSAKKRKTQHRNDSDGDSDDSDVPAFKNEFPGPGSPSTGRGKKTNGVGTADASAKTYGKLDGSVARFSVDAEGTPASLRSRRLSRAATAGPAIKQEQSGFDEDEGLVGFEDQTFDSDASEWRGDGAI